MSGKKIEVVELAYKAFQTEFKVSKSEAKRFALAKARIYELSAKARIRELGVHGLGGEIYEAPRSNPPLFFGLQTCEELASLGWLEVKMPGRAEELKRERAKEKDLAEFKGEVTKFSRTKTLLCNVLGERFAKPIKFERRNGATFISDGEVEVVLSNEEVEVVLSNDLEKSLEGVDSLVRRACEKSGIRGLGPQTIRVLSLKALERSSAIDSYAKVRKCKDGRWAKFPGADVVFSALHAATVVLAPLIPAAAVLWLAGGTTAGWIFAGLIGASLEILAIRDLVKSLGYEHAPWLVPAIKQLKSAWSSLRANVHDAIGQTVQDYNADSLTGRATGLIR